MTARDPFHDAPDCLRASDPFDLARRWLAEAAAVEPNDPEAMALATADADGLPDVRMVLLKQINADAFVFFTNYEGAKGQQLAANPQAALVLHWKSLRRQIRARGRVLRADPAVSDAYFASRPLQSRYGAVASRQSQPLESRLSLMTEVAKVAARHPLGPPRPAHWGGFRIIPQQIEFWADGAFRLHDRFRWTRTDAGWHIERLYP